MPIYTIIAAAITVGGALVGIIMHQSCKYFYNDINDDINDDYRSYPTVSDPHSFLSTNSSDSPTSLKGSKPPITYEDYYPYNRTISPTTLPVVPCYPVPPNTYRKISESGRV